MTEVILASGSSIRLQLLQAAGVNVAAVPAHVDEDSIKASLFTENAPALEAATVLAEMKAVKISRGRPGQLVIGADQILDLQGTWFNKPKDITEARDNLLVLRGQTHGLATACVIAKDGQRVWHHAETPKLTMRPFSDVFLDQYLEITGETILTSVGAYQLESQGVQLFSQVDGNYFSILGLPLFQILDFLRTHKVLTT